MAALIKSILGKNPIIHSSVFLAESAEIIGEVEIEENSSIWYGALLRGDVGAIKIGKNCNVQDKVVIHATYNQSSTFLGDNTSIGHCAIIHGAQIEGDVLVGMGAIVMDNVEIPKFTIIGAGALIPAGKKLESGWIYAGQPAKPLKKMQEEHYEIIRRTTKNYPIYAKWHIES